MANNSPTLVMASLSDDQLKKSIDSLVSHVDEAMKKMVQSTNNAVGEMEAKLKSLGNLKIDSNGTADGGASKRAKTQNAETDAVEKNIAARDKQIKKNQEVSMSFDQLASATQKAAGKQNNNGLDAMFLQLQALKKEQRELGADWLRMNREEGGGLRTESTKKRLEELREEIAKLETAYNAMLNASRHNQPSDIRGTIKDIESQDARYKQLVQQYKEEEKASQKRAENLEKERQAQEKLRQEEEKRQQKVFKANLAGALSMSEGNIEQMINKVRRLQVFLDSDKSKGFSLLSEAESNRINNAIDRINGKLAKQDQQRVDAIRKRQEEDEKANQKRLAAIEREKAAQDKVIKSYQDSVLKAEFGRVMKMPTTNIDEVRAKFERLSTIIANIRELGILSPEKIASADSEVKKLGASIEKYEKFEQERIAAEQKFIVEQAKEIEQTQTLEGRVKSLAQLARERLKEDGRFTDMQAYGKNMRVYAENDARAKGLSIEEQIARQLQEEKEMILQQTAAARQFNSERKKYIAPAATSDIFDITRQAVANKLGIKKNDVILADASTDSIKRVSASLKQLQDAYVKMNALERNSPIGQHVIRQMQELERQTQQLRSQMSRPISLKDALGGSEKTLDDIAYKMRQLASYRSGLNIKTQANEIEQVNRKYAELQKSMNDIMRKNTEMIKSNTALGRSWNYMKNRLAFYFTVGASTQFVKNLIEVRSQYEMNERALGILIDSAERGTQIFNELSQMALVSPYTLIELSTAAKQLTAYDIAAKDVVDTTRRLADMASAVGIPIERLTYALGQIKAYGYLNSRDARMFANAGIPLVKQLSDYYTQLEGRLVSTADVYDRIKKKTIDYEQVVQVINKMTDEGGKFFDFQAKMADTLKVRLANLTLAWNNMLNDMGSSNQGVLTTGIGLLRDMFLHWKDLENAIGKVAAAFGIYKATQLATLIWTGRITTAMGVQELVGKKLQARFVSLTVAQKGFVSVATAGWAALAFVVADAWLTISRNMEEIEQLNKSVAEGAKESYEAIDKMLHSSEMISTRLSAAQGKLSDTDAEKAWEMLREQIELSAASSKELIAQLLKEPDINKRVTESFNLAERIEEANRKLSDLNDSLDVSQNSILGGLFGEGLVEDIDDYNARLKYTSDVAEWASKKNRGFWENAAMGLRALFNEVKDSFGSDANEAQDEIKNFARQAAQTIKDELGEDGIKDKIQVNEAIARVIRGMEQQFPQIRGKGKALFETIFYDTMAKEFKGAVDSQAYYYEKFLEQLKKDHASAFSGVTEDINKETFKWSSAQIDAIQKTADKVKKDLPAASQGAIDEILRQLNSTDFKVRIVAEMATTSLDNVQKQFREKFIEKPWMANDKEREKAENEANQRYGTLMRKNTESNAEYEKRISDEKKTQLELSQKNADIISKNQGKEEEFSKAVLADAKKQKEIADDRLKAINEIEDKGGYDFSTKSENAAARKAAKQAESELAKALKDELSTIEKVRSIYKDLTKEGMSHADAVAKATKGWNETVNAINKILSKNGMKLLNLADFVGVDNPREMMNTLQSQLESMVKRGASSSEIKVIQEKIRTLEVDADKYDLTKITKGLNNELDRLKEEYELAVALDADPELGSIFANYMGINLEDLPRTAEEAAKKAQEYIDKILAENNSSEKIDISSLMDKKAFDSWVESSGHSLEDELVKRVSAFRSYLHKVNVDETKNQAQEWNKLLEKYAEYEYKVTQIQKEAEREREVARKKGASQDVFDAINNRERQEIARVGFEKFQKSPEWIAATGDLANMSKSAIGMLIEELERYKRTAKNLSPKEIKQLNNALSKLYKEQRKNNPFKAVANMFDEAKERMSIFDDEIEEAQKQIDELSKKHKTNLIDGIADDDTQKKLKETKERLSKLKEERNNIGKIDASAWVSSINETISAVKSAIEVFDGLAKAIGGVENSDVDKVFSILDSAGKGASTGAAFGPYGAIIGGVVGAAAGVVNAFADVWSGNERINKSIEVSTQKVRALEREYKRLERAVDDAYGTDSIGAQRLMMLNKEAELAELERQLELEKSRKAKNKDQEKIDELRDKVDELRYEVDNAAREIILDLLEIGDAQDWANDFVKGMIDAFRDGENYMKSYEDAFREMVDNMIAKTIAGKVIGERIEQMLEFIKNTANARAEGDASVIAARDALDKLEKQRDVFYAFREGGENVPEDVFDQINKDIADAQDRYAEVYAKAAVPTPEDIENVRDRVSSWKDDVKNEFDAYMEAFGVGFGSAKDSQQLSALQQGIQGITEDTAGAIEAYMNGVSQQVYYQSDILTQIRDILIGGDGDVQLGVQAQMLLQLQQSYQVQMSIQGILEGVLTPSGQGFRVELLS